MGHLLCIWILKIVLWYPCLQMCLKDLQFYLLQTDLLSSAKEKNSRELAKGSRNLFFFSTAFNQSSFIPHPLNFQKYLEPPIPRPLEGSAIQVWQFFGFPCYICLLRSTKSLDTYLSIFQFPKFSHNLFFLTFSEDLYLTHTHKNPFKPS